MAVASTPLVAAPSCPAWAKRRRGRQPQFDGKPCEPAEEEDMWLCLADGRARSTADLKRLATAARVRAKRAGDAAAANTRDRQARDQRRRQREQHDRRAAPAVAKTVRPQRGQCGCPAHAVCGMCVDQGKLAAAEQASIDLETRFHASTNVVMDLERPEDETAALLQRCVHVSDETKRRLLGEWSDERMAHALPLHACASCGVRDPSLTYTRVDVSALPRTVSVRVAGGEDETRHVFELSPEQCAKYRGLQNKKVRLAFTNGASNDRPNGDGTHEFRDTDISRVTSAAGSRTTARSTTCTPNSSIAVQPCARHLGGGLRRRGGRLGCRARGVLCGRACQAKRKGRTQTAPWHRRRERKKEAGRTRSPVARRRE